jgi:small multidrug resistance pump
MNAYIALAIAITGEVVATSALKASNSFTNLIPSIVVVVGYAIAFYFLTITLKTVPVGIAYAMWGGLGIVLVTIAGFVLYQQKIDLIGMAGIALIVAGVVILNVFSKTSIH